MRTEFGRDTEVARLSYKEDELRDRIAGHDAAVAAVIAVGYRPTSDACRLRHVPLQRHVAPVARQILGVQAATGEMPRVEAVDSWLAVEGIPLLHVEVRH
jgi:hypothetical protein